MKKAVESQGSKVESLGESGQPTQDFEIMGVWTPFHEFRAADEKSD